MLLVGIPCTHTRFKASHLPSTTQKHCCYLRRPLPSVMWPSQPVTGLVTSSRRHGHDTYVGMCVVEDRCISSAARAHRYASRRWPPDLTASSVARVNAHDRSSDVASLVPPCPYPPLLSSRPAGVTLQGNQHHTTQDTARQYKTRQGHRGQGRSGQPMSTLDKTGRCSTIYDNMRQDKSTHEVAGTIRQHLTL